MRPMKTIVQFLTLTLLLLVNPLSRTQAQDRETQLTVKATQLKVGMKLKAVKELLGEPQWASIVSDTGRFAIRERNKKLVLRWRNRPCAPVRVTFSKGLKVTDWDDGRLCGINLGYVEPPERFSCDLEDRRMFCRR